MLLFIRADIDGAKTVFASFIILGLIPSRPSRPVAFVEFNPFIKCETQSVEIKYILWNFAINKRLKFCKI